MAGDLDDLGDPGAGEVRPDPLVRLLGAALTVYALATRLGHPVAQA